MARKGRKRKPGIRTKSGRLSESKAAMKARGARRNGTRDVVLEQPHRRWLDEDTRADQRAATVLGRLYLAGKRSKKTMPGTITEAQCMAGERWLAIINEFHVILATPMTRVSSAAIQVADSGEHNPADADYLAPSRPETEEERRDRVLDQYGAAMKAIRAIDPNGAVLRCMDACIIHDRVVCEDDIELLLKRGLDALVQLWRLDMDAAKPIRSIRNFDRLSTDIQPVDEEAVSRAGVA